MKSKTRPFLLTLATTVLCLLFYYGVQFSIEMNLEIYLIREIIVAGFIYLVLRQLLKTNPFPFVSKSFGFDLKKSWYLLGFTLLQCVVLVIYYSILGLPADFFSLRFFGNLIMIFLFTFLVGVYEEGLFRGLILNCSLYYFGASRKGYQYCALLNGLLFGLIHIASAIIAGSFIDWISLMSGFFKILQTGMVGYFLAALYLKNRNLLSLSFIHGLMDFLLFGISYGYEQKISTTYVLSGNEGLVNIAGLALTSLFYLPLVISAWRILKSIDHFEEGFFSLLKGTEKACKSE